MMRAEKVPPMPPIPIPILVLAAAFAALLLTGGIRDLVSYIIPNWISLAVVGLFPLAALAAGLPLGEFGLHLAIGAGVLILAMGMYALKWIGGGDAKLFAAAAVWMGWPAIANFALWTALTGGGLAVVLMSMRTVQLRPLVLLGPPWLVKLSEPGGAAPYGVAIAVGGLTALPSSPLLSGLVL
jgi:prepilin peptidase CpaA